MMCLWASYKKKYEKNIFFASFNQWRKESDPELDPEPDPGIRIRTKMSRIPSTGVYGWKRTEGEKKFLSKLF
jgi:hypothetical protein